MAGNRRASGVLLAVVAVVAAGSAVACSDEPLPCLPDPLPGVAIAVGAHAHSARPVWPDLHAELATVIPATEQDTDRRGVTLVRVDGRPSIGCVLIYDNSARNAPARNAFGERFRADVQQGVSELTALQPEANPLQAMSVAAAAAGPGGTVVLVDSGLQTVAPLDFRETGLLGADIDLVVSALREAGMLPDLQGRAVVLAGIGWTAEPQAALSESQRSRLLELWRRIAVAGGATSVRAITAPSTSPPVAGLPPVSLVPIPPPGPLDLSCDTEAILSDTGPVGFVENSTTFVDDDAAQRELADYGAWLAQHPNARAHVTGSIAHYGVDTTTGLSLGRAERVRAELIGSGAAASQVTAEGAGWGPFPTETAPPDPDSDALNRRVVIELSCR